MKSGAGDGGFGPMWQMFLEPPAGADRQGEKQRNKAHYFVWKMAVGRKCFQHNNSMSNYIWNYWEMKNIYSKLGDRYQTSGAP
jgi:hypothetical protein